jgi:dTDP-4-amino-4,6-dideoxygalactose transaminase
MINLFQPSLGKEELQLVEKVFDSNWIGKGDFVNQFETEFSEYLGAQSSNFLSTTSCTEGLFLASDLFEYGRDDEIIAPSISFVAVGSSVVAKGAKLVLCDVDSRTLNATAKDIEKKITSRTKAVILNHFGGVACDMDPIVELCRQNNIKVIEDSACAVKSFYKGRACGTMGDMGLWSFDAMKTISLGDGGMVYLKSMEYLNQAKEQLYLGLPARKKSGLDSSENGHPNWWEFDIARPGRRAVMNNIAGAIGVAQLQKLDGFISKRREIHEIYRNELGQLPWLTLPLELGEDYVSSHYFFWVQLSKRDELAKYLLDNDVYTTFRYWPLHKISYFDQSPEGLDNSEYVSGHTLNLPIHPALMESDLDKIVSLIKEFGRKYM